MTSFHDMKDPVKDHEKERGAVLLTTLLIMSTMAILAIIMVEDILLAVKRTAHIESEAQAEWYMDGASDYTDVFLSQALAVEDKTAVNVRLREEVNGLFPIEEGVMSLSIRDSSNCLSLLLLNQPDGTEIFSLLFETLGWERRIARSHAARLTDWVDGDEIPQPQNGAEDFFYLGLNKPYRAANTHFSNVFEMRALGLFEPREFDFLRPFICARKPDTADSLIAPSQLNLNTLTVEQAPLLAVALGRAEHLQLAQELIANRPPAGWADLEAFWAAPSLEEFDQSEAFVEALLGLEPNHVWVDVAVSYLSLEKRAAFEYRLNEDGLDMTYRYIGEESHWPRPINLLQTDDL
ncbi:MAG: type II secretion system minor pseudopilin GspK [Maricaulaceae bacterium]